MQTITSNWSVILIPMLIQKFPIEQITKTLFIIECCFFHKHFSDFSYFYFVSNMICVKFQLRLVSSEIGTKDIMIYFFSIGLTRVYYVYHLNMRVLVNVILLLYFTEKMWFLLKLNIFLRYRVLSSI